MLPRAASHAAGHGGHHGGGHLHGHPHHHHAHPHSPHGDHLRHDSRHERGNHHAHHHHHVDGIDCPDHRSVHTSHSSQEGALQEFQDLLEESVGQLEPGCADTSDSPHVWAGELTLPSIGSWLRHLDAFRHRRGADVDLCSSARADARSAPAR
eukprot:gene46061-44093_t